MSIEPTELLDATSEGIYGVDLNGVCTFINRAGARLLGYEPDALIGRNMHQAMHHTRPDGTPYPEHECPIFQAFQHGKACRLENDVLWRQDGSSFPAEYASNPVVRDGVIVGAAVKFSDITDRKIAEQKRSESELRKAAILATALDCIITIDRDGLVREWNTCAEKTFGYAYQEAVGRPMADLIIPARQRAEHRAGLARYLETGEGPLLGQRFETTALRSDGSELPVEIAVSAVSLNDSPLFTGFVRDVSDRKQLEKLRDDLTDMIVHDLRTPLTGLLTGLETLPMLGALDPVQQETLDIAVDSGQTLLRMVNDLLDVSKMENGPLTLNLKSVDAAALVESAIKQVALLARDQSIVIECRVADNLPPLVVDEDLIRRTLVNLLGNAVKFTPVAGSIDISVDYDEPTDRVVFAVTDTGEGIPEDAVSRIFDKFAQVESRRAGRKMSTGLGLTFCRLVVDAHGGEITVRSKIGEGSTFYVALPAHRT